MQEMQVQSMGREDPLEEEMATHSSILAWRISQTEKPGRLQSRESKRVRHDLATQQQQNHLREKHWVSDLIGLYKCEKKIAIKSMLVSSWFSFL